jgi:hypothetical protein
MRRNFTRYFLWIILFATAISMNLAFAKPGISLKNDTSYIHIQKSKVTPAKNSYLKNGLHLALPPLKPSAVSTAKVSVAHADDKLLNDVQVFPNPITDEINLKYSLSRNANVTIKVMDVLGNDVITLLAQRVNQGDQNYTYPLNNQLPRGFYFVRIVAGTESVIKRISVL